MRRGFERRFHQLVDDVLGGGPVRVAHAEIDNVFSAAARGNFHLPGNVEDVRRQALNTAELFHDDSSVRQWSVNSGRLTCIAATRKPARITGDWLLNSVLGDEVTQIYRRLSRSTSCACASNGRGCEKELGNWLHRNYYSAAIRSDRLVLKD